MTDSYRIEIRIVKSDGCSFDPKATLIEAAEFDMSKGTNPWDVASAARELADKAAELQSA